jgi:hypothetical protein
MKRLYICFSLIFQDMNFSPKSVRILNLKRNYSAHWLRAKVVVFYASFKCRWRTQRSHHFLGIDYNICYLPCVLITLPRICYLPCVLITLPRMCYLPCVLITLPRICYLPCVLITIPRICYLPCVLITLPRICSVHLPGIPYLCLKWA